MSEIGGRRHSTTNLQVPNNHSGRRGSELRTLSPQQQTELDIHLKSAQIAHQVSGAGVDSSLSSISRKGSRAMSKEEGEAKGPDGDRYGTKEDRPGMRKEEGKEIDDGPKIREVVKSAGLVFSEKGEHQFILSKPKIMPIKSKAMEKLQEQMDMALDGP